MSRDHLFSDLGRPDPGRLRQGHPGRADGGSEAGPSPRPLRDHRFSFLRDPFPFDLWRSGRDVGHVRAFFRPPPSHLEAWRSTQRATLDAPGRGRLHGPVDRTRRCRQPRRRRRRPGGCTLGGDLPRGRLATKGADPAACGLLPDCCRPLRLSFGFRDCLFASKAVLVADVGWRHGLLSCLRRRHPHRLRQGARSAHALTFRGLVQASRSAGHTGADQAREAAGCQRQRPASSCGWRVLVAADQGPGQLASVTHLQAPNSRGTARHQWAGPLRSHTAPLGQAPICLHHATRG